MADEEQRPRDYYDKDLAVAEIFPFAAGTAGVLTIRSPDHGANEDSAAVLPVGQAGGVLAVADGFGGRPHGEKASKAALKALRKAVEKSDLERVIARYGVLNGFEAANAAVLAVGAGAATTLLAADIDGQTLRTYNVGDSMLLVVGQRGKEKLRTLPHSPVGYAVEAGMMDDEEAMHHEDRHYVTNMVGSPDMRIELTTAVALDPMDTVVLASDGLWDNLHLEEVIEIVRTGPVEEVMVQLAARCRKRMADPAEGAPSKPDDCTVIVYRPRTEAQSE